MSITKEISKLIGIFLLIMIPINVFLFYYFDIKSSLDMPFWMVTLFGIIAGIFALFFIATVMNYGMSEKAKEVQHSEKNN